MEVGIIGLERSGKTTLFNALTGSKAQTGGYTAQGAEPNVAVVKVPDARLDALAALFDSKKIVHATIKYIDVAGIPAREGGPGGGLNEALLKAVVNCDALLAVVRGFEEGGRAHNAPADAAALQSELTLTDLIRVETRLEKIEKSYLKQVGDARKALEREKSVLTKCKEVLEAELPIRTLELDAEEEKVLRAYQFMTAKPLILVVNVGEDDIAKAGEAEARLVGAGLPKGTAAVACCARSEMDIVEIDDPEERKMFLESYGITEPAAARLIRVCYATLGLMSFFTVGPPEAHAWTIHQGDNAVAAAGAIHSDLARGFIRAEVITTEDLLRTGSMANAKKEGAVKLEGKTYIMRDGDIIEVRFSV